MKRGDIYYINKGEAPEIGCEMHSGRPAIILGMPYGARIVNAVYLTTQPRQDLPTHVRINSSKYQSTALCEQITSVSSERVGDYMGHCSDREMQMVDVALQIALGIDPTADGGRADDLTKQLIRTEAERDTFKSLYENAIAR